jgi:hypothetical protein
MEQINLGRDLFAIANGFGWASWQSELEWRKRFMAEVESSGESRRWDQREERGGLEDRGSQGSQIRKIVQFNSKEVGGKQRVLFFFVRIFCACAFIFIIAWPLFC